MVQDTKPTLYVLNSGEKQNLTFSFFAWRTQLALKHKNVDFDEVKLNYSQIKSTISELTNTKWTQVPTLKYSNEDILYDSRPIALQLEERYPEAPLLFPNGKTTSKFLENYVISNILSFFGLLLDTEWELLEARDQEAIKGLFDHIRFAVQPKEKLYPEVAKFLAPISLSLKDSKFIEGEEVTYSDYIIFGFLQWFRIITPNHFKATIEEAEDKTVFKWFESILDLHDGYARSFPVNTKQDL